MGDENERGAMPRDLADALHEMIRAYRSEGQPIPGEQPIFESLLIEA